MRTAVYRQYGPPEVVTIQEVMTPSRRKDEVLVRVHASTVNRNDRGFRTPAYRYLQAGQKLGNVVVAFG
ncbi:MAG: hypothetical protein M3Q07_24085 [Pseudobdellovibrionaceae bacterium]|nr:hypothetical protein [Pseudobdellovibrionaceae bacterium]